MYYFVVNRNNKRSWYLSISRAVEEHPDANIYSSEKITSSNEGIKQLPKQKGKK